MSLMKRALDAARLRLGRIGRKVSGAVTVASANVLPSARGGGKRLFEPVWTGNVRSAYTTSDSTPDSGSRSKQQRRARDRQMRAGLPTMSGRQWQRIRKAMYRRAKFLTIQQQESQG